MASSSTDRSVALSMLTWNDIRSARPQPVRIYWSIRVIGVVPVFVIPCLISSLIVNSTRAILKNVPAHVLYFYLFGSGYLLSAGMRVSVYNAVCSSVVVEWPLPVRAVWFRWLITYMSIAHPRSRVTDRGRPPQRLWRPPERRRRRVSSSAGLSGSARTPRA